jgi:DNA-binding GntR family transcriptional regulator
MRLEFERAGIAGSAEATIAEEVCRRIADDIVRGQFPPGTKLEGQQLADRYGISRTPVREALRQLVATGLVEVRPHKGFAAAAISSDRLSLMFEALGELEALCARFAAQRMTAAERRKLDIIFQRCRELADESDAEAYFTADNAFHDTIIDGAHNEYMAAAAGALRVRLAPFRFAHFRVAHRSHDSAEEHARIVESLIAGKANAAEAMMREHVTTSAMEAIESMAAHRHVR